MTKENAKDFLPLVQALAEGKTIQTLNYAMNWIDNPQLTFNHDIKYYRIKPEPPKPKDIWVNEYEGCDFLHPSKEEALSSASSFGIIRKAVHYREVIE